MSTPRVLSLLIASVLLGCGSGEVTGNGPTTTDGMGPADDASARGSCTADRQCDDGQYCNGAERCDQGFCRPGEIVRCDDGIECTRDACDEISDTCQHTANHAACDEGLCDPASGCVAGTACTGDADCDDGVFCNGTERCGANGACEAGEPVACDDGNDCTADQCSEERRACSHDMRDSDGDGHGDSACRGGDDCDDDDRGVRPGAREVCDDGRDNDCNRERDCSDPQCENDRACREDDERADRDERDDRDGRDDRESDPCLRNGWYNDGDCDAVCAHRDPDCDRDRGRDTCDDRRWYRDGICDDSCRRQDPDCPARGDDSCRYANDGECDEGGDRESGACARGTDTTDCRPDQARRGSDTCRYANDGTCDERTYCERGTDGRDCTDGGPNSCYWANDGTCDHSTTCAAGTDSNDCGGSNGGSGGGGAGTCGGLTYQGRCRDAHTVEYCIGAGTADERRETMACGDTRECRFQDAQTGYTCVAPGGASGGAGEGGARTVPAGWTCSPSYYAAGDDCDCNCGARDPDCDNAALRVLNCESGQTCGATGQCSGQATKSVPAGWSCSESWYDTDDGCDCNCGIVDPDCSDANATVYHCDAGEVCSAAGRCVVSGGDGEADEDDDDGVPAGWTCSASYYDADDGCDCDCGVRDPDCTDANATVYRCEDGQTCNAYGQCEDAEETSDAPYGWTCSASYYDANDGCDCGCGVRDPDCDDADAHVYGCEADQTCDAWGSCAAPEGNGAPAGWTCSASYYGAGDGCDCECGAYDPDCNDESARVYNCDAGETCGSDGTCEWTAADEPADSGSAAPWSWTCADSNYAASDGCDCDCGAYDPDCDDADAQVYNCGYGQICGWDGTCEDSPEWI